MGQGLSPRPLRSRPPTPRPREARRVRRASRGLRGRRVRRRPRPCRPAQVARPMTPSGDNGADKTLGEIVTEVSEKASLLVREEIELAKSEVTDEGQDAGAGRRRGVAAAGVFLVFAVVMLLHTLAWLINDAARHQRRSGPASRSSPAILHRPRRDRRRCWRRGGSRPARPRPTSRSRRPRSPARRSSTRRSSATSSHLRRNRCRARGGEDLMSSLPANRTPEQIRNSIEDDPPELAFSVNDLRSKVARAHQLAPPAGGQPRGGAGRCGRRGLRDRRRGRRHRFAAPPAPRLSGARPAPARAREARVPAGPAAVTSAPPAAA